MIPQLHVDQVFNMKISKADAELLSKAILCAGHITVSETFDRESWKRLETMRKQLTALAGWQEQS